MTRVRALRLLCLGAVTMVITACGASTHALRTPSAAPSGAASIVSSAAPAATEVVAYSPYANDVPRPGLVVAATVVAPTCDVALHDLEPLRCMSTAGPIYDPCFPDAAGNSCLYVASPTAQTATKVSLGPPSPPQPVTSPQAKASWPGYHPGIPWAIELSDGTMCVFSHGAADNVDGLRPEDGCTDGRFLFGDPIESAARWSVRVGASISGPLTGSATIERVWIFAATGPVS